ncbi:MAG TPA: GH25 family lysozyme [Kofleriaceae bacterium]|nr:GH25 family lysozyme [Kofleriaceae bacterium]
MRGLVFATLLSASCAMGGHSTDDSKAGAGLGSDLDSTATPEVGILARVCAAGTTTQGVDVSYFNGTIDWAKVKAAGNEFAFIRISDGTGFHDPQFAANWAGAKTAGVVRGIYQFFRPAQDVNAQADMVIAAAGTPGPGDLPPVIDVEVTGSLSPASVAAKVRTWVDRVKAGIGIDPIVYTGKFFWRDQVGGPTSFAGNPLWIAQYTSLCPDLTPPWDTWAFWQYSDTGKVAGMSGDVDLDRFNGSLDELRALAGGGGGSTGGGGGGSGATTCASATTGTDEPEGTCVQAASDQKWYQCVDGSWIQQPSTAGCTQTFGWCESATLGRAVPPRTCVQKSADQVWYQCDGTTWVTPVDAAAATGPAGACSHEYPL